MTASKPTPSSKRFQETYFCVKASCSLTERTINRDTLSKQLSHGIAERKLKLLGPLRIAGYCSYLLSNFPGTRTSTCMYVCLYRHTIRVKSACNHRMVEAEEVGKSPCPTPAQVQQYPGTTLCFWVREAKHGYPIHMRRCRVTSSDNQLACSLVAKCYSDIAKVEFSSLSENLVLRKINCTRTKPAISAKLGICSKCLQTLSLALCVAFIPGLSGDRSLETFMKGPKGALLFTFLYIYIFYRYLTLTLNTA